MSKTISHDERPLGQLVWWLMFLGWTPILASYGYVLDPVSTFETGAITTFTSEVTLFQQRGFGHPALGILILAALIQALAILRLGWHALWPLPVFLGVSSFIYVFNGIDTGAFIESATHAIYAVFATWAAYLFLRHGHLMSVGFGSYVALLVLDVVLHWLGLEGGLLGFVFFDYAPSLVTTAIFLALTILTRMVWLMFHDNRGFIRSLDRGIFRQALRRTLRLWWPMPVIFLVFGVGWWAFGNYIAVPAAKEFTKAQTEITKAEMETWISDQATALAKPRKARGFRGFLNGYIQYAQDVARLERLLKATERSCGPFSSAFQQRAKTLETRRGTYRMATAANVQAIAHAALLDDIETSFRRWEVGGDRAPANAAAPPRHVCDTSTPDAPKDADPTPSKEETGGTSGPMDEPAPATAADDPLERSLQRYIELQTLLVAAQTQLAIIEASKTGDDLTDLSQRVRKKLDEDLIPENELPRMAGPKSCFPAIFRPKCVARKTVADSVNGAMLKLREGMIDAVVGPIDSLTTEVDRNADETMLKALAGTRAQFDELQRASVGTVKRGFQTWRNISLLATLYSVIILFKTFLIVFSRVIFSPKVAPDFAAPFLDGKGPTGPPEVTRHAQLLRIPVDEPDAHFVSRSGVTIEGPPPARRRPLGFRFPVIRMLTGTWSMNRIDGSRNPEEYEFDAHLKVDEPSELVSWRLREGEQVVFRFHDFVGMSETVKVRRVASLSITTLILGRMIYYVAEGPGMLILRTNAAARLSSDPEAHRPAPMPKLVAWAANAQFGILAAQTTVDTFLSGYNLKTGTADAVIWDTSTRRGNGPGTGILRFVKSFLLPI